MSDDAPEALVPLDRESLIRALHFALRRKVFLPMVGSRRARWESEAASRNAAEAVADHLALSGLRLFRPATPMQTPARQQAGPPAAVDAEPPD